MFRKILVFSFLLILSLSFADQIFLHDNLHLISNNYSVLINSLCSKAYEEVHLLFEVYVLKTLPKDEDPYLYIMNKFNSSKNNNNAVFILLLADKNVLRTISAKSYRNILNTNEAFNANLWSRREWGNFLYYYIESLAQDVYSYKGIKFTPIRQTVENTSNSYFGTLIIIGLLIGGGGIFYHRLTRDIHKCPNCKSNMSVVYKIEKEINSKKVYEIKYKCDRCGYEYVKIKGR